MEACAKYMRLKTKGGEHTLLCLVGCCERDGTAAPWSAWWALDPGNSALLPVLAHGRAPAPCQFSLDLVTHMSFPPAHSFPAPSAPSGPGWRGPKPGLRGPSQARPPRCVQSRRRGAAHSPPPAPILPAVKEEKLSTPKFVWWQQQKEEWGFLDNLSAHEQAWVYYALYRAYQKQG